MDLSDAVLGCLNLSENPRAHMDQFILINLAHYLYQSPTGTANDEPMDELHTLFVGALRWQDAIENTPATAATVLRACRTKFPEEGNDGTKTGWVVIRIERMDYICPRPFRTGTFLFSHYSIFFTALL